MLRTILIYGTIAGLIVAAPTFGLPVAMNGQPEISGGLGMVIGYTTMLVALSAIFIAIKRSRDIDGGGVISFWRAFAIGLGVSVVAAIFYVLAWEAALAVTGMDFAGSYAKGVIAQKKAAGASAAELKHFIAEMDAFRVQYANPLYRLPMTFTEIFPVGVLVSLISAGLLRNRGFLPAR